MKKITVWEQLVNIVLHIFRSYELSTLKSTENIHSQQVNQQQQRQQQQFSSFGASTSASQPYSLDLLSEKKIPFSFRGDAKKRKGDEIGLIEFNRMGGGLSHSGGSTSSIATVSSESTTVSSTNTYTSAFVGSVSSSSTSELSNYRYSPLSTESSLPSSIMAFMQPSSSSSLTSSLSEYGPVSHNSIFSSIGAISRNLLSLDKISMGIARSGSVLIQPPP
ncbi:uncharacterized protein MONOS_11515 [Monocercomonoides exilis]|uniref:uncharacterized protein n=1 Tax=Monocercomonoides exilis TaxID=2049356 RepID=UPI00355A4696|nr:hypothetical protein MONOS_11515 [Monocercomonoides exilis]|eukprot:MONOS_11515.1-p1 / transcript=MONOS_11515.1 / gene=MONOS_11515 / organism=Monocercomonoides_exilis_PA203 / gene_product=unspecified product / transcript_product=unspecified product / location=Mono_scaffold00582:16360-17019(+) / protein_length=220 / sequence_SO=supercontig / SO=protein_coding / is_pseudo=false